MSEVGRLRGTAAGVLIDLSGSSTYQEAHSALVRTLAERGAFLGGARVVLDLDRLPLMVAELEALLEECREAGLESVGVLSRNERVRAASLAMGVLQGPEADRPSDHPVVRDTTTSPDMLVSESALVSTTVRSGHSVWSPGNVVVLGDVNPGAEIVAGGSVIVWGTLRGTVHAGTSGVPGAVVCALSLEPTQLRIGDHVARTPDGPELPRGPEMARVLGAAIVVDEWPGAHRRGRRTDSRETKAGLRDVIGRVRRGVRPWGE